MEWNLKAPLELDMEHMGMYGGKSFEFPTRLQFFGHKDIDEVKENESGVYSASRFSVSQDPSVKEGLKSFSTFDGLSKDVGKNETFPCLSSGVPMTGLKLGRQTYIEDRGSASAAKSKSSCVDPLIVCSTTKRSRQSHQSAQTQRCQVEGCNLDLVSAKGYHRRHKICESHSKSPKVIVAGMERRFCQQCSRFHDLSEFDDKKRSCRRRLLDHNARRRRPQPDATKLNDQHPRMNFLQNNVPRPVANQSWETDFRLSGRTLASDSHITLAKVAKRSHAIMVPRTLFNDASAITSTSMDVHSQFQHAPSLLSSNSWAQRERESSSLEQLVYGNRISLALPVTHSSNTRNWEVSSMEYVRVEQTPTGLHKHLSSTNTQHQQHQSLNVAHDSNCFYSNQLN